MIKKNLLLLLVILLSCKPQPQKKWVAIGDSITYLNDHKDETGFRVTKGYLTAVTEKLPHLKVVKKGYNGWTVIRIAENLEKIEIPKADYYSIFLGTNDWYGGGFFYGRSLSPSPITTPPIGLLQTPQKS